MSAIARLGVIRDLGKKFYPGLMRLPGVEAGASSPTVGRSLGSRGPLAAGLARILY